MTFRVEPPVGRLDTPAKGAAPRRLNVRGDDLVTFVIDTRPGCVAATRHVTIWRRCRDVRDRALTGPQSLVLRLV